MVFCCIAIVAMAIVYFTHLWIRQMFLNYRRDKNSRLPVPPRTMSGHGALPVYGHTRLFAKLGGDVALLFPPHWVECSCLPRFCSRKLGECYSIFIFGQWRVAIKGPENAKKIMESQDLKPDWPWTPPLALLGKSCLPFLEEKEAAQLKGMIRAPLSNHCVVQLAPAFADLAEKCIDDMIAGNFARSSRRKSVKQQRTAAAAWRNNYRHSDTGYGTDDNYDDYTNNSCTQEGGEFKVKWDALRSYTFDLIDGPILNMKKWIKPFEQTRGEPTLEIIENRLTEAKDNNELPSRERMLTWMERMKRGLDVIKLTFGPEWMYVWTMNEYGRALNARMYVERIIAGHVELMVKTAPVTHKRGHTYHDPSTQTIPLLALRNNIYRLNESIFGEMNLITKDNRAVRVEEEHGDATEVTIDNVTPFKAQIQAIQPRYEQSPSVRFNESPTRKKLRKDIIKEIMENAKPKLSIDLLEPTVDEVESPKGPERLLVAPTPVNKKEPARIPTMSLLERLLRESTDDRSGISQTVMTEICIILWMMMDVGNGWTAMALNLLSSEKESCALVQSELDALVARYGHESLFTPKVLKQMRYLDALIYEAIRLSPPFLGGLKVTTAMTELENAGVQVPKGSHIFFCQATSQHFSLENGLGKRPELLGKKHPCPELYGFLPLDGLEVPVMVLQTKVFLIAALQRYSPYLSMRKTFIRRVVNSVMSSSRRRLVPRTEGNEAKDNSVAGHMDDDHDSRSVGSPASDPGSIGNAGSGDQSTVLSPVDAHLLFDKLPFPEPRRVIRLRPRVLTDL